jgi:ABC-type transport system substrate-binding protein
LEVLGQMSKNFAATVTLAITLMVLCGLVLFHTYQVNHFEELAIASQRETAELSRRVNRLYNLVQSGEFQATSSTETRDGADSNLAPVVRAQRRYYRDQEWTSLLAPGNFMTPRTLPYHLADTVEGGTFNRSFINDIPGLNPITVNAADVSEVYRYINRRLSTRARNNPDVYVPELAYRVEVNEDFTQYHIWLREGVQWHRPNVDFDDPRYAWLAGDHFVTADDFAFYFEVIQNTSVEAAFARNYYEDFDRIEVINDHEFIVYWSEVFQGSIDATLTIEPLARWLYAFDEDGNEYSAEEFGTRFNQHWFNTSAIGVGPYRLANYEQNVSIELERFDDYYDEPPPIERMVFRIIPDANTRLNEIKSGGIAYMDLEPLQYDQAVLREGEVMFNDGTIEHELYQSTVYRYLGWNADRPLFSDSRARRAMTHALNRERMIADIFHGLGRVITGNFFVDGPYYNNDLEPYPFDLERAAELLDQAGWIDSDDDGVRDQVIDGHSMDFEFTMLCYGYRPEFMAAMDIYKNDLASIGVVMHVDGVQWAIMVEHMEEKDFDAYTGGWVLSWDSDPYQIWHSSQADEPHGSNRVGFRNDEADEIIETCRRTFDVEERISLLNRFHAIVHEEQPYTFFFAPREVGAWRSHIQNVSFAPLRPFDYSHSWYVDAN